MLLSWFDILELFVGLFVGLIVGLMSVLFAELAGLLSVELFELFFITTLHLILFLCFIFIANMILVDFTDILSHLLYSWGCCSVFQLQLSALLSYHHIPWILRMRLRLFMHRLYLIAHCLLLIFLFLFHRLLFLTGIADLIYSRYHLELFLDFHFLVEIISAPQSWILD